MTEAEALRDQLAKARALLSAWEDWHMVDCLEPDDPFGETVDATRAFLARQAPEAATRLDLKLPDDWNAYTPGGYAPPEPPAPVRSGCWECGSQFHNTEDCARAPTPPAPACPPMGHGGMEPWEEPYFCPRCPARAPTPPAPECDDGRACWDWCDNNPGEAHRPECGMRAPTPPPFYWCPACEAAFEDLNHDQRCPAAGRGEA